MANDPNTDDPWSVQVGQFREMLARAARADDPSWRHYTPFSPEDRLVRLAKTLLNQGVTPPSWQAALELARAVLDLHGEP